MKIDDDFYMQLAIDEAWKYQLKTYPNPAVGAVVVKGDELLSISAHQKAGGPHAEVLALKEAYVKKNPTSPLKVLQSSYEIHNFLVFNHDGFFEDCTIYITLEPCNHFGKTPACSDLLTVLAPKKVVISQEDPNIVASGGIQKLKDHNIEVETGCKKEAGRDLLFPFLRWQVDGNFIFFKMATRLNGSISGGYISSSETLDFVHQIRDNLDLLVIGGNTVREDKPILDARRVDGKAPNIQIVSREVSFDKSIPLFNVPNREVRISTKMNDMRKHKFVMVEGGYRLLKTIASQVDMFLFIVTPSMKDSFKISNISYDFEIMAITDIGSDKLFWLKLRRDYI
jgi:diaminohydroxyphosphoribosylaminopyrimidine deaminase/5-amino-6-(5-phosphoribosylamino)uracil reductase